MRLLAHTRMVAVAMAVGVVLSAAGMTGAAAGSAHAPAASGAQLWARRYAGPASLPGAQEAAVAYSPDGKTVLVTGTTVQGIVTIAYNAATGARRWLRLFGAEFYTAYAMAVSPDGKRVFVTGGTGANGGYATVAYNAATGARAWAASFNGPKPSTSVPHAIAVSPSSGTVFVTGYTDSLSAGIRYATVAYSAATGTRRWTRLYRAAGAGHNNQATAVAASPGGRAVYVSGWSFGSARPAFETIAYSAASGKVLWMRHYRNVYDLTVSIAVSPGGKTLFVAGSRPGDYVTVAYATANGAQRWTRTYTPGANRANAVAVSPDGKSVFVTGSSEDAGLTDGYLTIAYNAATGARRWTKVYHPARTGDQGFSIAVSPRGNRVYVAGLVTPDSGGATQHYGTIAYAAATGARLWARQYKIAASGAFPAYTLAVSPRGSALVVSGTSHSGYATVAYSG
jgi:DNA-binding beta-propeller fold protein YncE